MIWLSMLFHKQQKQPNMSAEDCCVQGKMSYNAGKYLEAMEFFQAAIDADSHCEKAYILLSDVYKKQGKLDKAKSILNALLKVEPNNTKALKKIDEFDGKPFDNVVSTPSYHTQTNTKTRSGEISFKITKWFWFLLCFSEFVLSIVFTICIGAFDNFGNGGFENGLMFVGLFSVFFSYFVYKVMYLLIYRRDNWNGDKYGKGNYNPIVYKTYRNIIYIIGLLFATIALEPLALAIMK